MTGFALLLVANLMGVVLQRYGGVPLPGNVIGMLLMLVGLWSGVVKLRWVQGAADLLLKHMLLFFAPVVVGVMALGRLVAAEWPALVGVVVASTLATLLVTAGVGRMLSRGDDEVMA